MSLIDFGFDASAPATVTTRRPALVTQTVQPIIETSSRVRDAPRVNLGLAGSA